MGRKILLTSPGNYGLTFLKQNYSIDENNAVLCSNFVYDTVRLAALEGFTKMLFVGHIGKLVKVAGGIKNTHSMYGDHRMEILQGLAAEFASDERKADIQKRILECVMTDEAVRIINSEGLGEKVFGEMALRSKKVMESFSENKIDTEVIVFSNEYTELISTDRAHEFLGNI
jgi:cobalt-precorrin-5B (C1)-methyltransferase